MADPIRLHAQKRLTALLETVSWQDIQGDIHAMEGRVFRGKSVFGNETLVPFLSILEAPIQDDVVPPPRQGTTFKGPWTLVIQGFVEDDPQDPTDNAHLLMAVVKKAMAQECRKTNWDRKEDGIFGLGGFIDSLYIGHGVVRPPDELSDKAYFWLTIQLNVVEDLDEPYAY